MNPAEHARIKDLFLQAVALPAAERQPFLEQACVDETFLRHEVETLLAHHDSETIFRNPSLDATNSPKSVVPIAQQTGDVSLPALAEIVPQFRAETSELLRRRLFAFAFVTFMGLISFLVLHFWQPVRSLLWLRITTLTVILTCWLLLTRRFSLSLMKLRLVELAILLSVGVQAIITDVEEMIRGAAINDIPLVVNANGGNYLSWSVIILVYGIFMPNHWRRAAMIVLPAAFIPYLVTQSVCLVDPGVAAILGDRHFALPVPVPFLAAFTAIYAAHIIHTSRVTAFRVRHFAQYKLVRSIGKGGMGDVYEAEHVLLKRPCAVKLIRLKHNTDPQALARFEREVKATANLTHWNTIEIYDYGRTVDGEFYYVMELLPGMSVGELVDRHGPLEPARAIHLLRQVCGALQEAHDAGFIHRDIKPANIFASMRGGIWDVVKVLDFGLVRQAKLKSESVLTGTNVIAGTPQYMSPEQGMQAANVDPRSDVYSLGATAYFMLTGRPPFDLESTIMLLVAHSTDPVSPPTSHRANIPGDLEAVVLRCLEKDPVDRFQSMWELSQALKQCDAAQDWDESCAANWWNAHELAMAKKLKSPMRS